MSGELHITRPDAGVVRIVIDNPPRNALNTALRERFLSELEAIDADLSVRCLIITGTGQAFCSGDDLREAATRGESAQGSLRQFGKLLTRIEAFRCPVIASINGHAVGGGLELALCCDLRIASPAARFVAAGVNVGLMASVFRLPRTIGIARAKRMLLTGLPVTAECAEEWGLVTDLVPAETLESETLAFARRIASRAPLSVEAAKRQSSRAFDHTAEEANAAARAELDILSKSADHREGLAAFAERRDPKFTRS
ncbi:MAG TPA: enoyl-CoA hydratase/isomerase family protein [Hyphomonadaceae bacterium]|nr:enoyl-CoA hydratase/isomerase family protein [Hyphomonadaceae bacterium]